ncbi:hypothetical protein IW262DRAFT_1299040 [Armillaria fumosa]|nr:hypothetical protein IW262DRAFT_1299040 [Armillaria fumosa]
MSAIADEVHRKCNTMDAKAFLERFLSCRSYPGYQCATFQKVAEKTAETAMYKLLVMRPLLFVRVCSSWIYMAFPIPSLVPSILKPDISAYKAKDAIDPVTQSFLIETHIELKLATTDDENGHSILNLFVHCLHLCRRGKAARWDRSVVTVTHAFRYDTSEATYLQEFFWHFSHADDVSHGWDASTYARRSFPGAT